MRKNGVDIITLGCSKNLVDSEKLMHQLRLAGYKPVHDPQRVDAETVVINTCGFIGDAKAESIEMILDVAEAKKEGRVKRLYVMGCLSQRYFDELQVELPEVDKFYGKFDWTNLLADLGKTYNAEAACERELTTPSHYAYLKISEGCNRTCSYCSIPIITGKYTSRPIGEIVDEARSLTRKGVKEIQLIAQDLTFYGWDNYREFKLPELARGIADVPGIEWVRLHYAYPSLFPCDLLPLMREHENVCRYLDIALQHISDNMLSLMRRNITKGETYDLLERIRREVPGIHLRTTLMVGHPGETDNDFDELLQFVKEARFERMGAFAYSEEEGTYSAKHYKDDIPDSVKQERLSQLMKLQEEIAFEQQQAKIGETLKVVIDREEPDYYVGRSEFDSPEVDPEVFVGKQRSLTPGTFYDVEVTGAEPFDLFGEVRM